MTTQLENFVTQIDSLGALVKERSPQIADGSRMVLKMEEVYGLRQVILTGSGDSYFAAAAVAPVLRAWTGLPVTAMLAMEAARYVDTGLPPIAGRNRGLLVISISSSGEAARLVEATRRLRALGAITLAVTANADSRLGQAAERMVDISIPPSTSAPGTRSYVASLLGVYHLAIRIAEMLMCMTMDVANELRNEMTALADSLSVAAEWAANTVPDLVKGWGNFRCADCLGSGPSLASAQFAAAKLVEAAGVHATAQDAEEFHHLNYFVDRPEEVPTVLFAPARAHSISRKRELLEALTQLGRPSLIVTDAGDLNTDLPILRLPKCREAFAPFLQTIPAALIAAHAAHNRDTVHYRGHTGPWRGAQGAAFVRNSTIQMKNEGAV